MAVVSNIGTANNARNPDNQGENLTHETFDKGKRIDSGDFLAPMLGFDLGLIDNPLDGVRFELA